MTADPARSEDERGEVPEFDPQKPRSARLHDYWLGGKDNFAADRTTGMDALEAYPGTIWLEFSEKGGWSERDCDAQGDPRGTLLGGRP